MPARPRDGLARFTSAITPIPGSRKRCQHVQRRRRLLGRLLDLGEWDDGLTSGNISADSLNDGVEHSRRTHARRGPPVSAIDLHRRVTAATPRSITDPCCPDWSGRALRRARPRSSAPTSLRPARWLRGRTTARIAGRTRRLALAAERSSSTAPASVTTAATNVTSRHRSGAACRPGPPPARRRDARPAPRRRGSPTG